VYYFLRLTFDQGTNPFSVSEENKTSSGLKEYQHIKVFFETNRNFHWMKHKTQNIPRTGHAIRSAQKKTGHTGNAEKWCEKEQTLYTAYNNFKNLLVL
jgi:hypothetical protein